MTQQVTTRGSEWRRWDFCVRPAAGAAEHAGFTEAVNASAAAVAGIYEPYSVNACANILRSGKCTKTLFPVVGMKSFVKDKRTGFFFSILLHNDPELLPEIQGLLEGLWYLTPDGKKQFLNDLDPAVKTKGSMFVDFSEVIAHLKDNVKLKNNHLVILSYADRSVPPEEDAVFTKRFIDHVDLIDSADAEHSAFFQWKSPKYSPETINLLLDKRRLACVAGSGKDSADPTFGILTGAGTLTEKSCWIKADPTFIGLKQALIEPEQRIFIGRQPEVLGRAQKHGRHFIGKLLIGSTASDTKGSAWLSGITLDLNNELVAVIGSQGSGKGALADIIGVLGNSHASGHVFLGKESAEHREIAKKLAAQLSWGDGTVAKSIPLAAHTDPAQPENLKYLPLDTLQKLGEDADMFASEIERVIYSHYPETKRLGAPTFHDLVSQKIAHRDETVTAKRLELKELNRQIIALEAKSTPANTDKIKQLLTKKQQELVAHEQKKSAEVENPEMAVDTDSHATKISAEISTLRQTLAATEQQRQRIKLQERAKQLTDFISTWDWVIQEITTWKPEAKALLKNTIELDIDTVISFGYHKRVLEKELEATQHALKNIPMPKTVLKTDEKKLLEQSTDLQKQIDGKVCELYMLHQKYQKYLADKLTWEEQRRAIEGEKTTEGTIAYYKGILEYFGGALKSDLNEKYIERKTLAKEIFRHQQAIHILYMDISAHLRTFLDHFPELVKSYDIAMDISSGIQNLPAGLSALIGKKADGGGTSEAVSSLITDPYPVKQEDILSLIESILDLLQTDRRQSPPIRTPIHEQLKGEKVAELYDYLFGLQFLNPQYRLLLSGKPVSGISPMDRRLLLVVYYLVWDKEITPLIIDRPESLADHAGLIGALSPLLRRSKGRRQVILVTEDPKLAILADAEQIIRLLPRKEHQIEAISGSLENPVMRQHIQSIMLHLEKEAGNKKA